MSTNLPADEQEAKPAQNTAPGTQLVKADLKLHAGTAQPDSNGEADKPEVKKCED